MSDNRTEFVKVDGRKNIFSIKLNSPLLTGGREGSKFRTQLINPRHREGKTDISGTLTFISKEYKAYERETVLGILDAYQFLRSRGYPVPSTTRYYEKVGRVNLLMSDMTEGGKYKIWGPSGNMSHGQLDELRSMSLTKDDIISIQKKVSDLSSRAAEDRVMLFTGFYHIRKNISTGEIDIVLLDVEKLSDIDATWTDKNTGQRLNETETIRFMEHLERNLSSGS